MALRGLAYSVRMSAYNTDGERVSGIASTITATLWADSTTTVLSGTITEIGNTGVYIVPLTATQMEAYNLCITAVSSTAGITFDPVYLDTEAGRVDTNVGSRLATSGYTTPPTVNEIQSGLAKTSELPSVPTVSEVAAGVWAETERTITGGSLTIEPPTAETIAESVWTRSSRLITGGAPTANSIASAVWANTERTLTDTPTYNGPTPAEIAEACVESIASTFIVPAIYGVKIERTSAYPDRRQQQEAFAARIQRMYDDSPLNPAFVESISYTAYKLDTNVSGTPSVIVEGHENVPVATSCLSATIQQSTYWTLDNQGCNFTHVPDQSENYLFPTAGVYEVVYTITLSTGSPITIVFNAVIAE